MKRGQRRTIFFIPSSSTDGPATINVNIYLRTISRIDDVKMVRGHLTRAPKACEERALIRAHVANFERALFLLKESLKMPKKLSFYDAKSQIL